MADTSSLYSTVKNTSGVDRFFGHLPPHGKLLKSGQSYTIPGDLTTRIAAKAGYDRRRFRGLERDLMGGKLTIVKTPAPIFYDAAPVAPLAEPTVAATTAETVASGALATGTYYCAYTWYNANGETTIGASTSAQFTVTDTSHRTTITIPSKPSGATGANIYITPVNGAVGTLVFYKHGVTGTTYAVTDAAPSFASVPSTNTAVIADPTVLPGVNVTGGGIAGGLLAAGTYYLLYTFTTPLGETLVSPESDPFVVVAGDIPEVILPALPAGANGINIYLTAANGSSTTETLYASGVTTTIFQLKALYVAGAAQPGSSTAKLAPPVFAPVATVPPNTYTGEAGTTGGELQAGLYYAKITYTGPTGETTGSPESLQFNVPSVGMVPSLQVVDTSLTVSPTFFPPGVTGANVYLTAANGAAGAEKLYLSGVTQPTVRLALPTGPGLPPITNTTGGRLNPAGHVNAGTIGIADPSWGGFVGPQ